MNQDMKYGYLDETYETICPLGEQDIFSCKKTVITEEFL